MDGDGRLAKSPMKARREGVPIAIFEKRFAAGFRQNCGGVSGTMAAEDLSAPAPRPLCKAGCAEPGRDPPSSDANGEIKVFIGTVQCEIELAKSHPAFKGYRFLLIEAEHEVEWEGSVVAIDLVDAQVGDLVMAALAPLGTEFDLPQDLPIDGAVIGIVGSITTPAEDEEEEAPRDARARRSPDAARGRGDERRPERSERPERMERPERNERPERMERPERAERPERREDNAMEDRPRRRGPEREGRDPRDAQPAREPRRPEEPRPVRHRVEEEDDFDAEPVRAPRGARPAPVVAPIEEEIDDDLQIVWDAPDAGDASVGGAKKRTRRRRR